MADQHSYEVTIDGYTYAVDSDHSLSDAQAYQAAKAQHDVDPEVLKARNDALIEANKKPLPKTPTLGDEFTGSKMLERGVAGAKGTAAGLVGGVVAPAALAYQFATHPVDTAKAAGKAVLGAGVMAAGALQHPVDTFNVVKDSALAAGKDPTTVGGVVGGIGSMFVGPKLFSMAAKTRAGQAAIQGVKNGTAKIPIVGDAVKAYQESAPAAKRAKLANELGVEPNVDPVGDMPDTPAPAPARVSMPLAHDSAAKAAAADKVRKAAEEMGVASDVTSPESMPLGVGDEGASLAASGREPIPVPVRLKEPPPPPPARPPAPRPAPPSSFEQVARELGLDPKALSPTEPPVASAAAPVPTSADVPPVAPVASAAPATAPVDPAREALVKELLSRGPAAGEDPTAGLAKLLGSPNEEQLAADLAERLAKAAKDKARKAAKRAGGSD